MLIGSGRGSISVVTLTDVDSNITRTIAFGNAISAQSLQDFDGTISEQVKQAIAGQLGSDTFEDVLDNLSDVVDLDNAAIDNHPPLTVSAHTPSAALAGLGLMGLMGTRRRRKA